MKCPHCGFVTFDDARKCGKCGHLFAPSESLRPSPLDNAVFNSPLSSSKETDLERQERSSPILASSSGFGESPHSSGHRSLELDLSRSGPTPDPGIQLGSETGQDETIDARPATAREVSERFKRRQAAVNETKNRSLAFDFGPDIAREDARAIHELPRRTPQRKEISLPSEPVTALPGRSASLEPDEVIPAPLTRRFLAGLADVGVLLAAGAIFAGSFRLTGGHIQSAPMNIAVIGFITMVWLFAYFAAFSALTFSTPGQAALGLTLRNFEGELPTRSESLLRAFGYLVSIASLMLGFLWAAMDSDELTWHDHISGTVLIEHSSQ